MIKKTRKPTEVAIKKAFVSSLKYQSLPAPGTPFILYKKVQQEQSPYKRILALYVPADALRVNGRGREAKARVSKAFVICAYNGRGAKLKAAIKFSSLHDPYYKWHLGKWHGPKRAFARGHQECASGLHGFLSKKAAMGYG